MQIDDQATQQALQRIANDGSDMSKPLVMDFSVAISTKTAGLQVADAVEKLGFVASVERDDETNEWTCYCSKSIIPSLAEVVRIERQLDTLASRFGGRIDGFGTFGN